MTSDATRLIADFEDIALQRYLMSPRALDRALTSLGWTLRYAVDTNVLGSFITPDEDATSGNGKGAVIGVGEIFRHDELERKQAIAATLTHHIWFELQPEAPLLLLPPLHHEFKRTVDFFARQRTTHDEQKVTTEFQKLLADFGSNPDVLNADYFSRLREVVIESDKHDARIRRLRMVFSHNRLRNAHSALDPKHFDEHFRKALKPEKGDMIRSFYLGELKEQWTQRLVQVGRPMSTGLRHDAEALARLELANRELEDHARRLIYITNDNSVLEAGEAYLLQSDVNTKTSFASCFLRHPRAFLDEPNVLKPSSSQSEEATSLSDWMNLILGRFDGALELAAPIKGKVNLAQTTIETLERASNKSSLSDNIKSGWSSYEAASTQDAPNSALYFLLGSISKENPDLYKNPEFKDKFKLKIAQIRTSIQKTKDNAWEDFFEISKSSRFVIEMSDTINQPIRDVAPACFEGRPKLHAFLIAAKQWMVDEQNFSSQVYEQMVKDIREEDDSGYSDYLGHANLLAHHGQWRSAAILCLRAKERLSAQVDQVVGSNGREANYLEAFYRRYSAQKKGDLDGLEDLIDQASNIYEDEKGVAESGKEAVWPHDAVPERFESERLALRLTRTMFDWAAASDKAERQKALVDAGSLIGPFQAQYALLSGQITNAETGAGEPSGPRPKRVTELKFRTGIRKKLQQRSLINILSIGLLNPDYRNNAMEAWRKLNSLVNAEGTDQKGKDQSRYVNFLRLSGAALFHENKKERAAAFREILDMQQEHELEAFVVFPYDERRFKAIIDIVKHDITKP